MNIVTANAPGFIWLIVGVFWVIAQIAGAASKKQQASRPVESDPEPGTAPVDPFAELMRKMAGVQPIDISQQEYNNEPEYEKEQEEALAETETMPDIEPLRHVPMGQEIPQTPVKLPRIAIRPTMSSFRNSVPSIKMPTMNMSFQGSETSVRKVPNLGKILNPSNKNSLRRAMLSHIIFSPPKALEKIN